MQARVEKEVWLREEEEPQKMVDTKEARWLVKGAMVVKKLTEAKEAKIMEEQASP